jgi:hypothetical protein
MKLFSSCEDGVGAGMMGEAWGILRNREVELAVNIVETF